MAAIHHQETIDEYSTENTGRRDGRHSPHGMAAFLEWADPERPLDELPDQYQEWLRQSGGQP